MRGARIFLAGQAVSELGDGLALLAIPLLVLSLTQSPVAAVLASLPASAGYLAAGLPAGLLADRVSPRLVLACGDAIRAALFIALFTISGARATLAGPTIGSGNHAQHRSDDLSIRRASSRPGPLPPPPLPNRTRL